MASSPDLHPAKIGFDGSGTCLVSDMYKIFVGPEKKLFQAHEAVLSRSPVFERMCSGTFKESVEKQIDLPDDDAIAFGCVLEFMYLGVFHGDEKPDRVTKAALLADVYILADKYQLEDLKDLLICPLGAILETASEDECLECFFDAARKIYENNPDSDFLFPRFFKQTVTHMLNHSDQVPHLETHIRRCIYEGGKLAQDTFDAYYEDMTINHEIDKAVLENQATIELGELQRLHRTLRFKHDILE
ncbi:hypothetical protein MMC29_007884, partial [Sticta canariensis]|nr:hypothetical protein [Sticta canariensis]